MARTIEAFAPTGHSDFTVDVVVDLTNAVTENVAMTEKSADKQTYTGTLASASSVGNCHLNYKFGSNYAGRASITISAVDGSVSLADGVGPSENVNRTGTTVGLTAAAIQAIWDALTSALTTVGSIGKFIVDRLGFGGTGARTVTITVNDGVTALQNARVRLAQGAESYVATTNASGVATLWVDDATWNVSITKPGYSFASTTLVVDGNETVTYSVTTSSITAPADPTFCTLAIRVWTTTGTLAVGVNVKVKVVEAPTGEGELFNSSEVTDATGADGYATFTVPRGCSVKYWVGTTEKKLDAVGTDSDVEYVDNHIGIPA